MPGRRESSGRRRVLSRVYLPFTTFVIRRSSSPIMPTSRIPLGAHVAGLQRRSLANLHHAHERLERCPQNGVGVHDLSAVHRLVRRDLLVVPVALGRLAGHHQPELRALLAGQPRPTVADHHPVAVDVHLLAEIVHVARVRVGREEVPRYLHQLAQLGLPLLDHTTVHAVDQPRLVQHGDHHLRPAAGQKHLVPGHEREIRIVAP